MKQSEAYDLVRMLKKYCPVDTGQLKGSIQPVHIEPNSAVIIIGNGTASTRDVPSNVYAAFTNNAKTIGKNRKPNPNYHWANNTIMAWAKKHAYKMILDTEEDDE